AANQAGRSTQRVRYFRTSLVERVYCSRDRHRANAIDLRWIDDAKLPAAATSRSGFPSGQSPHHENGVARFEIFAISPAHRVYRRSARTSPRFAWRGVDWNDDEHSAG